MANFVNEGMEPLECELNRDAMKNLSMTIKIVDKTSGEEHVIEREDISAIRFKEVKGHVFLRLKGVNGNILSIPKAKIPKFIEIEEEKKPIW